MPDKYTHVSACMKHETSPARYSPMNTESVLLTEALIAESHRDEFQAHIILLKSGHHFSKAASSGPGQSCPPEMHSGKPFRIFDQNQKRQNVIKL